MRDDVTLYHCLPLAGHIYRMIPAVMTKFKYIAMWHQHLKAYITVTSYKLHSMSIQWQVEHLFNNLFKLTKGTSKLCITSPLWGKPLVTIRFCSQSPVMCKMFSCHDITMSNMQLIHWGSDKMAAIFQTAFSNACSWMKIYELRLKFHWSLFLRVQLTIFQHWFR